MIGADAGMVRPGSERAGEGSEKHAGEGKGGGDEGTGPASAEVGEFGNGLGEDDLVGVALKVAEDGRAEDGGHDDDAEQT